MTEGWSLKVELQYATCPHPDGTPVEEKSTFCHLYYTLDRPSSCLSKVKLSSSISIPSTLRKNSNKNYRLAQHSCSICIFLFILYCRIVKNMVYHISTKFTKRSIKFHTHPHSTVILREYFKNIPLKSCNIARIFIKLLEMFLKYCRNLAMSAQNIINVMLLQYWYFILMLL